MTILYAAIGTVVLVLAGWWLIAKAVTASALKELKAEQRRPPLAMYRDPAIFGNDYAREERQRAIRQVEAVQQAHKDTWERDLNKQVN